MQPNEITAILNLPISQELLARDLLRMAYVAKDGTPRNVPIAFTWNGSEIVVCTTKNAPKLPSLRHNPEVALTIDTEVHPPKILLIRGRVELDVVDGIPEEYLQMNGSYDMTPEQRVEWEAEVRSLYDGMVRIVVTPTWAKLIDFETTLPTAVEELVRQRAERQRERRSTARRGRGLRLHADARACDTMHEGPPVKRRDELVGRLLGAPPRTIVVDDEHPAGHQSFV
jgi:hypothetical protein